MLARVAWSKSGHVRKPEKVKTQEQIIFSTSSNKKSITYIGVGLLMGTEFYDPTAEAVFLGLKVNFFKLKKMNSFILEKIVYLRENMNKIEKRCSLTYEIVKYLWNKYNRMEEEFWHSNNVENILKQQTARKLVCPDKFAELYNNNVSIEEMEQELEVTKEYLMHYINYCKTIQIVEDKAYKEKVLTSIL